MWRSLFRHRRQEDELMDMPSTSREDFTRALKDIQWVNRNLGGIQAIQTELQDMIPQNTQATFSILDLGTGSADIPIALAEWARRSPGNRVCFHITAVDLHPVAIETARHIAHAYPEIDVRQGDALHWPALDQQYDFVISSMFMHHLSEEDAIRLLQEMARLCRYGLIVNDLQRHPMAWLGIRSLGVLTGKGHVFRHDAPLSVLRGFDQSELEKLRQAAGLPEMIIRRQSPYRWVLRWQRPGGNTHP